MSTATHKVRKWLTACAWLLGLLGWAPAARAAAAPVTMAALAWSMGAVSVGMPAWPGVAVALAARTPPDHAAVLQAARNLRQRADRPVTRSLRAMLRTPSHHAPVVALHAGSPKPPSVLAERPWLDAQVHIAQPEHGNRWQFRSPEVQCDVCAASAAEAEAGEDSIHRNLPDINVLTTFQLGTATLKVTSLQPFSLLFKKHF